MRSGDVLGRYELAEEIGEGGMATVFRARDRELRREVAVKVLFPHLARRAEIVRRFHREARAAAGLEHANILRIYDVGGGEPAGGASGEPAGRASGEIDPPYIVMELIRGRTLLEEIEQHGAMLAEIVACIGALLAEALAAAHAALIVHRDIKPSNVLIAPGGRLLLADFGVARLETETSLITRTGALLGTPAYMSPEQSTGDIATAKSDLYSLGATLYQLATGALPYSGSPAKVMSLIASGMLVSPVRRRAAVGPDLSKLIERLMAIEPEGRPASASVIAGELRALAVAGGLGDPTDELAAYFADPAGFVKTCTPKVVTAVVTAAERAITEARLPRAIALADRASALAPDDAAVTTLVRRVTEGGRASRRRRLALIGLATGALAAGGTALGMQLAGSDGEPEAPLAIADARMADANRAADAMSAIDGDVDPLDAGPLDAGPRDAAMADAGPRPRDAGPVRLAAVDARVADAAGSMMTQPTDAPPADGPPPVDAPAESATLVVTNDTWCDVTIDGVARGKINPTRSFTVPAGPHVVVCEQPNIPGHRWSRDVEVLAGKLATAKGDMLAAVEVTIEVDDITIGDIGYSRGLVARLKPRRYPVQVGGRPAGYLDIPRVARCRVRVDAGKVVCDP